MRNWKTDNQSFIDIATQLKKEYGVKDYDFMLELLDEKLIGLDTHSKTLTPEMQARVYLECTANKWYFLREVVRIPVSGNDIPYLLNLGNLALTYMKTMNVNQITLLPRQAGKTIGNIADDVWVFYFGTSNTNINYLVLKNIMGIVILELWGIIGLIKV